MTVKYDADGQQVLPRKITHFGDGETALTNRDVSLDLKALIDDSIKGVLRSIGDPGAAPANVTGKTLLKVINDIAIGGYSDYGYSMAAQDKAKTTNGELVVTELGVDSTPLSWTVENGKTGYLKQLLLSKARGDTLSAGVVIVVKLKVNGVLTHYLSLRDDWRESNITFAVPLKIVGDGAKTFSVVINSADTQAASRTVVTLQGWEE